jgi:hypothetical protein
VNAWKLDGEAYPGTDDFTGAEIYDVQTDKPQGTLPAYLTQLGDIKVDTAPGLMWLWVQAQKEWQ